MDWDGAEEDEEWLLWRFEIADKSYNVKNEKSILRYAKSERRCSILIWYGCCCKWRTSGERVVESLKWDNESAAALGAGPDGRAAERAVF